MTPLRSILDLTRRALSRRHVAAEEAAPFLDPIDHPALQGLSVRELADLPLPRPAPAPQAGGTRAAT